MDTKGSIRIFIWGFAGVLLAALLSLGAFALAGDSIGEPVQPKIPAIEISSSRTPSPRPTASPSDDDRRNDSAPTSSSSPSDDKGGHGSEPGDDHDDRDDGDDREDDNSGSGGGDDDRYDDD
jgi:hypothetical protein